MPEWKRNVHSFAAFMGCILWWSGLWYVFDLSTTEETVGRDLWFSVIGVVLLLVSNTYFATAGMDQTALFGTDAMPTRCMCYDGKVRQFFRSLTSLVGQVLFWTGMYNLWDYYVCCYSEEDEAPEQPFDVFCLFFGLFVLWATDTLLGSTGLRGSSNVPQSHGELTSASLLRKIATYLQGLTALVASVVYWKGAASILDFHLDEPSLRRELIYIFVGLVVILIANALISSGAIDEDDPSEASAPAAAADLLAGAAPSDAPSLAAVAPVTSSPTNAPVLPSPTGVATPAQSSSVPTANGVAADESKHFSPDSPSGAEPAAAAASSVAPESPAAMVDVTLESRPASASVPQTRSSLKSKSSSQLNSGGAGSNNGAEKRVSFAETVSVTEVEHHDFDVSDDSEHSSSGGRLGGGSSSWRYWSRRLKLKQRALMYSRGLTALFGVTVFWTGVENVLYDYLAPEGLARNLVYMLIGFVILLFTKTIFMQAGVITPLSWGKRYAMLSQKDDEEDREGPVTPSDVQARQLSPTGDLELGLMPSDPAPDRDRSFSSSLVAGFRGGGSSSDNKAAPEHAVR